MSNDPYAALGLTQKATAADIKKAYRKIARDSHPDLNPDDAGAEARFKAASAAYDLLKDPESRARFDRGEIDASGAERQERRYYRDYADAAENPYQSRRGFEDADDTSDIFAEFLRQQQRGRNPRDQHSQGFRARGGDAHYTLDIPFLDAVNGGKTRITLPDGGNLEVKIPQGTTDGQTIRLRGKGGPGLGGGPAGDALVTLSVAPHAQFRREGLDIHLVLPITIDEAVLGGRVEAQTIEGTVGLTIPAGASGGQVLRLRGRGVRTHNSTAAGDQLVELRIVSPPSIDAALKEFMQGWRKDHAYDPRKGPKK